MEVWDSRRLNNLLRLIHELPSSGFPFGIFIENVLEREGGASYRNAAEVA
jgi:hypothetical protein